MRYPSPPGTGERVNHRSAHPRQQEIVPAFTFEGWYGLLISESRPRQHGVRSHGAPSSPTRGATTQTECYILPALETP